MGRRERLEQLGEIGNVEQLDELLAAPSPPLVQLMKRLQGDIMIIGAGGKMGPSLTARAVRAVAGAGVDKRVVAVSRFTDGAARRALEALGAETIRADVLDRDQLGRLPDVENVIFMVGHKFGTQGREHFTWAMNAFVPGLVAERFRTSRIVAFSSGNVYPLSPVRAGGSLETDSPSPVGEYAQSCLGRERVMEHFARANGTPALFLRLNYAIDLRYGVLHEVAAAVHAGQEVNLKTGHVNVIWQGDANDIALRALEHCSTPPKTLNVTGPETIPVRWLAEEFGRMMGKEPRFSGGEQDTALLSNAAHCMELFGYPQVTLRDMMKWTSAWVRSGGPTLGKPTHFQEREGRY